LKTRLAYQSRISTIWDKVVPSGLLQICEHLEKAYTNLKNKVPILEADSRAKQIHLPSKLSVFTETDLRGTKNDNKRLFGFKV